MVDGTDKNLWFSFANNLARSSFIEIKELHKIKDIIDCTTAKNHDVVNVQHMRGKSDTSRTSHELKLSF